MDPLTISLAVGVASKAFSAIKQGFAVGRDLEQMSGDVSRWMGAASDVDNAQKQAKNPGIFGKVFERRLFKHGEGMILRADKPQWVIPDLLAVYIVVAL